MHHNTQSHLRNQSNLGNSGSNPAAYKQTQSVSSQKSTASQNRNGSKINPQKTPLTNNVKVTQSQQSIQNQLSSPKQGSTGSS